MSILFGLSWVIDCYADKRGSELSSRLDSLPLWSLLFCVKASIRYGMDLE